MDLAQAVLQNLAEANQDRRIDAAQHQLVDQFLQIDAARWFFVGMHPEMAVLADREIAFSPGGNIVQFTGVIDGPSLGGFEDLRWSKTFTANSAHLHKIQVSFGFYSDGKYNLVTNATSIQTLQRIDAVQVIFALSVARSLLRLAGETADSRMRCGCSARPAGSSARSTRELKLPGIHSHQLSYLERHSLESGQRDSSASCCSRRSPHSRRNRTLA